MEKRWTEAQMRAIKYRGKNLLVSAAAGSGKTATLTERIIRLIADDETSADISRMLVVTFTKAAASELRERVSAALSVASSNDPDNRRLADQVCRVGDAKICTIDSFLLSCVKPMFSEVGLPLDFRMADKGELAALREEAMEETVNSFYDSTDGEDGSAFGVLAETLGSAKEEAAIDTVLLEFEEEAQRRNIGDRELYFYADQLEKYTGSNVLETPFGKCIIDEIISGLTYYGDLSETVAKAMSGMDKLMKSYVPSAYRLAEYCRNCVSAAKSGDIERLRTLLSDPPDDRPSTREHIEESEIYKEARKECITFAKSMYSRYLSDSNEVTADVMRKTAQISRAAGDLVREFRRRFGELKRQKGIADHNDISRMAAELLSDSDGAPTAYGESIAAQYDYVFIDEYQDTNYLQDRIFSAVASKCGRFMVGDIKQSIYGFRGGEPSVFAGYREAWSEGTDGDIVFMSENFRCAEPVTAFVNAVSRHMFPYGGIPFDEEDLLIHGRNEPEGAKFDPVEVCLIERPTKPRNTRSSDADVTSDNAYTEESEEVIPPAAQLEAEYVAKRIRHMLDHETLPDGNRIKAGDIAVMSRTKDHRELFEKTFAEYGIPMKDGESGSLFTYPEILLITCILRATDNSSRDVYLAGAMRSAAFGFTLGEIAQLKNIYKTAIGKGSLWDAVRYTADMTEDETLTLSYKCRSFCDRLNEYRTFSKTVTAAMFIRRIINDPSVSSAIEEEGGVGASDRVTLFYEIARSRDCGLYEFLQYLSYAEKQKPESVDTIEGDGVSFMTVHHSKGLEFPVCFLINAGKEYNTNDAKRPLILDRSFGPAMKLPDSMGLVRCDNFLRRLAVFRQQRISALEEMRVLYVALTRARERLIVTTVVSNPEKKLAQARMSVKFSNKFTVQNKTNYMDIILEAMHLYGGDFMKIVPVGYYDFDDTAKESAVDAELKGEENSITTDTAASEVDISQITDVLADRFEFKYPYDHLENIPSKLTVSRLYPEILDEYDDTSVLLEEELVREPAVPKFMMGTAYSPADAGNAAHVFLQFCDFQKLNDLGTGAELCRLVSEGYLSKADGEAANLDYIDRFRRSEFFKRILSAREIRREFRFNAALPAYTLTGDDQRAAILEAEGTDVIVQGVIDIVFTDKDGRLVLADYKTDRLTSYEMEHKSAAAEKLWKRHKNQLRYYALVCEKLFGRSPDEVLIYSMPLGEEVREGDQ